MKRTKNMVYRETEEARELYLYAVNDYRAYETLKWVKKNLEKKMNRGTYNKDRAVDAMYRVATIASDEYKRCFGYGFSVQDRFTCATDLEEDFRLQFEEV